MRQNTLDGNGFMGRTGGTRRRLLHGLLHGCYITVNP